MVGGPSPFKTTVQVFRKCSWVNGDPEIGDRFRLIDPEGNLQYDANGNNSWICNSDSYSVQGKKSFGILSGSGLRDI